MHAALYVVGINLPRQDDGADGDDDNDDDIVAYRFCTVDAGGRRQLYAAERQALASTVLMLVNLIDGSSISPLIYQGVEGTKGRKWVGRLCDR